MFPLVLGDALLVQAAVTRARATAMADAVRVRRPRDSLDAVIIPILLIVGTQPRDEAVVAARTLH
jgi:hypothetical protein